MDRQQKFLLTLLGIVLIGAFVVAAFSVVLIMKALTGG